MKEKKSFSDQFMAKAWRNHLTFVSEYVPTIRQTLGRRNLLFELLYAVIWSGADPEPDFGGLNCLFMGKVS